MNIGKLRQRLTFLEQMQVQDSTGGMQGQWLPVFTVWGQMLPLSGREFYAADRVNAELTARAIIRYRRDVTAEQQILWNGKYFNIAGPPVEIDGLPRQLELHLIEMPVGQPMRNPE